MKLFRCMIRINPMLRNVLSMGSFSAEKENVPVFLSTSISFVVCGAFTAIIREKDNLKYAREQKDWTF